MGWPSISVARSRPPTSSLGPSARRRCANSMPYIAMAADASLCPLAA